LCGTDDILSIKLQPEGKHDNILIREVITKVIEHVLVSRTTLVKTDRKSAPGVAYVHKKRQMKESIIVLAEYIR